MQSTGAEKAAAMQTVRLGKDDRGGKTGRKEVPTQISGRKRIISPKSFVILMKKSLKLAALVIAAILILSSSASAQEYYADVVLDVSENGSVAISGATNHPLLAPQTTQELTKKTGSVWEMNIDLQEEFSEYVLEIRLPAGAGIIDINLAQSYRLSSSGNRVVIIGAGQDAPFFARLKYEINAAPGQNGADAFAIPVGIVLLIAVFAYWKRLKKNRPKQGEKTKEDANPKYDRDALTERQLLILGFLEKKGGKATQAELQEHTGLPKASLSRNLDALARKGIAKKERKGMTMLVSLEK